MFLSLIITGRWFAREPVPARQGLLGWAQVDTRGQVFAIGEDTMGTLWAGFWHGLYSNDRATGELLHAAQPDPGASGDWRSRSLESAVRTIHADHSGDLWAGTSTGLYRRDRTDGTFTHYRHDPDDPNSLSHDQVLSILEDPAEGVVWIGTGSGLNRSDPATRTFTHYSDAE